MSDPALDEVRLLEYLRTHPALPAAAAVGGDEFELQRALRRDHPADAVRAALSLVELRRRAAEKFPDAARLWFDRVRFEQATPAAVAAHKARRFADRAAGEPVLDLCCGMGLDATALAAVTDVRAVDLSPAAVWMTARNAEARGVAHRLDAVVADARDEQPAGRFVHIDPDRRPGPGGRAGRKRRLEDYEPDLAFLRTLAETARGGAIKVGPASNWGGKFDAVEVELLSLGGECKEATVWFGDLCDPHTHRATVLPATGLSASGLTTATLAADPLGVMTDVRPAGAYLFDPDPAVVRAGLVDELASRTGLWRTDDAEEYLTGDAPVDTPFATTFRVLDVLANNPRAYRAAWAEAGGGPPEVKCRHLRTDAAAVARKLPRAGDRPLTLFFARLAGKSRTVLCERVSRTP